MTEYTPGPDGFWRDRDGRLLTTLVDSFRTAILDFPQASVIGLYLCEAAAPPPQHGQPPVQLRMTASMARRLAAALQEAADALDGAGAPRQ